jgi:hypothetical protein
MRWELRPLTRMALMIAYHVSGACWYAPCATVADHSADDRAHYLTYYRPDNSPDCLAYSGAYTRRSSHAIILAARL